MCQSLRNAQQVRGGHVKGILNDDDGLSILCQRLSFLLAFSLEWDIFGPWPA